MEFYDEKDMAYWRGQAKIGKAVILEIPVSMLLDLDISSLNREKDRPAAIEDLYAWMDENREKFTVALAKEREEKAAVEKLERTLYDKQEDTPNKETKGPAAETRAHVSDTDSSRNNRSVAQILAKEVFSEEQMAVIAQAMLEELPEEYMLCFMKKDYSPATMRQIMEYLKKLHKEERSGDGRKA